ncbi:DUF2059 domain-containing protein [Marinobacter mobilis]|uniref:DUF2059 domain-containing protein n=1 Tax=Marinobacter mobilis TaxID=488533 RepID=A0A1H2VCN1_9GAMM|nr:DUF2059 domain-containing protein [Marinobacter mobilis]SDW65990.1 hypothetical protein SAMN04487960_103405 [Marinobacter mobilis]
MVFMHIRTFVGFVCLFLSASLMASENSDAINELMDKSGLTEQVASIPLSMKQGMSMAQGQSQAIPDPVFQAMLRSADGAFVAEDILQSLREALVASLTPTQVDELLDWYNSPLGIEITEAEKAATGGDAQQEMMAQAKKLLGDQQRVKFASRLDKLFGATDMVMDLQQYTSMAVFSAIMMTQQPGIAVDLSAFGEQISQQIEASRPMVEQGILLSLLHSYQGIEMDKLNAYENFLQEPGTRQFNGVVMGSLNRSLEQGIEAFARNLAELIESNIQQS